MTKSDVSSSFGWDDDAVRCLVLAACVLSCMPLGSAPATTAPTEAPSSVHGLASPTASTALLARSPSPTLGGTYTPPPLNALEVKVISALAALGISGRRAQLPYQEASIWAELGPGSHLFVSAYPTRSLAREARFTVLDERRLDGIRVQHAQHDGSQSDHHRFECAVDTYMVRGAVPPGFRDTYAFVAGLIRALGCVP